MFKENRICRLLGIKHPIIQGGMAGISDSSLVSAVSNAGGLGVIGSGLMPADWLEKEIELTQKKTNLPFGVNLFIQNPKIEQLARVVIEKKVPVVFTGGGNPLPLFSFLHKAGIKIIPVVPSPRLAAKMEDNGADAVVVEGLESGGHIGESTTFCLIPQTKQILKRIPFIAAGGIYDKKTKEAALLLGAEGVQMGTRFLASKECPASEDYKEKIIKAKNDDIEVVLRFTGHPIRVIRNQFSERMKKIEEMGAFPEEVKAERIAGGLSGKDIENIPLMAGLCAADISEVKSCQQIIEEIAI